ncbi:MAG: hypothetical protein AAFZ89_13430, partial [Bacteroidota bacterium]
MKKVLILVCIATFLSMSCKSSDKVNIYRAQKEQVGNSQISLLNMMRKVPGVVLRGNTPVLRGTANSI